MLREFALLYRERQLPFDPKGFCEWGAKPQIKEFRN
jgi:2,3-dihydroxy-p-cumate/2,3-dihydroxybenzoate 3,4-dioxygenase